MSDNDRLNEILECIGRLNGEIKSPAEELLQDALILVLEELRKNRLWQAENQKNWTGI